MSNVFSEEFTEGGRKKEVDLVDFLYHPTPTLVKCKFIQHVIRKQGSTTFGDWFSKHGE